VLVPILLFAMLVGTQAALTTQARAIALGAAEQGARVASTRWSSPEQGRDAAAEFATSAGDDVLTSVSIDVQRQNGRVRVVVSANSQSVLPGWNPRVVQAAAAPVEEVSTG
jgi:hypothetical protein